MRILEIKRKKRRSHGGFSLFEVVIALVVIGIITASAITLVMSSISNGEKSLNSVYAVNDAENAIDCLRFAESNDSLTDLMKRSGFSVKDTEADAETSAGISFSIARGGYSALAAFTDENSDGNFDRLNFIAFDKSDSQIYTIEYEKGQ